MEIKNNDNKLTRINDMLFNVLQKLNDDEHMKLNANVEIARSNAMANVSKTIVNSVKTNIAIMELKEKNKMTMRELQEVLGIINNDN